ncbi:MAG: AarF/UbiB family protein [Cytophagales bacterium]|nr:AarF/UbiB family protein [Cytophagales bacterium]
MTYLKLGQFIAMRHDMVPANYITQLNKLYESVPAESYDSISRRVKQELGQSIEELFQWFDPVPIAAASVAQVHKATTKGGELVAVKVQRSGVNRDFASDIRNLTRIARVVDAFKLLKSISMQDFVKEFGDYTSRELNFISEGQTADRLRRNALSFEVVPKIHWELTTSRILTMTFLKGNSFAKVSQIIKEHGLSAAKGLIPSLDLTTLLNNLCNAVLNQLFNNGFFHGDPHPGNILVMENNSVGFVDFGIFGNLSKEDLIITNNYIRNLALGNTAISALYLTKLCIVTEDSDYDSYKKMVQSNLAKWTQSIQFDTESHSPGSFYFSATAQMRRDNLRMKMDFLLYWRALIFLESIPSLLDPSFKLLDVLQKFYEEKNSLFVKEVADSFYSEEGRYLQQQWAEIHPQLLALRNNPPTQTIARVRHHGPSVDARYYKIAFFLMNAILLVFFGRTMGLSSSVIQLLLFVPATLSLWQVVALLRINQSTS